MAASESYPDDLLYHREHDWARIEGDEAVLGITWYAQDALGELVHYEPPEDGRDDREGQAVRRGRVGQGRLRPDRAALGRGARGEPEGRRRARDGERGPLRRGLAGPHPDERPVASATSLLDVGGVPEGGRPEVSFLSLTDADREAMLAAIGVASVEELFRDIPAGRALRARARRAAGALRGRAHAPPRGARRARTSSTRSRSSAPASTTTTCRRSSTPCSSAASS